MQPTKLITSLSSSLSLCQGADLGFINWHMLGWWGIHRSMVTSSQVDRARVVEGWARVVYWGSWGIGSRWGRSRLVYWLRSRFIRSRSRRMVRSRVMIRVHSCSFIGNLGHIPSMMVCMVVHYLGATIRQGHGVGTFNNPSLILSLCFSKLSSRVLVSYSILILIGTSRFFIGRGMVYWGRDIRCWGFGDRRGIWSRGVVERSVMNWGMMNWGMMDWSMMYWGMMKR